MNQGEEILTLQFGPFSNYIGSHYWNIQDELVARSAAAAASTADTDGETTKNGVYDASLLFREGVNPKGQATYTPRLLVFDSKSSLGSLRKEGTLYSFGGAAELTRDQQQQAFEQDAYAQQLGETFSHDVWAGQVETYVQEPQPMNSFLKWLDNDMHAGASSNAASLLGVGLGSQQLGGFGFGANPEQHESIDSGTENQEDGQVAAEEAEGDDEPSFEELEKEVTSWTDYLKVHYHPKTIQLVPRENDDEFGLYNSSQEIIRDSRIMDDYLDNLRYFLEECDRVQGVKCLVDVDSGYGQLAQEILEEFRSEVRGASVVTFGVVPGQDDEVLDKGLRRTSRSLNQALSTSLLSEISTVYTPVSMQQITSGMLPELIYDARSQFQQSAVVAHAIDAVMSPFNMKRQNMRTTFGSLVSRPAFNVTSLASRMSLGPPPPTFGAKFADALGRPCASWFPASASDLSPWNPVSLAQSRVAAADRPVQVFGQLPVVRGFADFASVREQTAKAVDAFKFHATHVLPEYIPVATPLPMPFPHFFRPNKAEEESASEGVKAEDSDTKLGSLPFDVSGVGCLESSSSSAAALRKWGQATGRVSKAASFQYSKFGFSEDDWLEASDRLGCLAESYSE